SRNKYRQVWPSLRALQNDERSRREQDERLSANLFQWHEVRDRDREERGTLCGARWRWCCLRQRRGLGGSTFRSKMWRIGMRRGLRMRLQSSEPLSISDI